MRGYSRIILPLIDMARSNKAWKWTDECIEAFEKVKYSLTHAPVLRMSNFSKPFEVVVDALKYTLGAVFDARGPVYSLR